MSAVTDPAGPAVDARSTIPRDVRDFVAAHHLTRPSAWRSNVRTAGIVTLYLSGFVLGRWVGAWWLWVAIWLFQAAMMVGSYSAMHEAAHGTLYQSRRANRIAGTLWGLTIGVNSALWRCFHLQHHARTGHDDDPEPKLEIRSVSYYLLALPVGGAGFIVSLLVSSVRFLGGTSPSFVRPRSARAVREDGAVLLVAAAVGGFFAVHHPVLMAELWLAPFLLCIGLVFPATGLSEHYGCARVDDPLINSRTVISNRIVRFLFWNNNFHAAHHLCPSVPFYCAPTLHRLIEGRTQHISGSYMSFHWNLLRTVVASGRARRSDRVAHRVAGSGSS